MKASMIFICAVFALAIAVRAENSHTAKKSWGRHEQKWKAAKKQNYDEASLNSKINLEIRNNENEAPTSFRESAREWFFFNSDYKQSLEAGAKFEKDIVASEEFPKGFQTKNEYVWFPENESGIFVPFYLKEVLGVTDAEISGKILNSMNLCKTNPTYNHLFPVEATYDDEARTFDVTVKYVGTYCKNHQYIEALFTSSSRKGKYTGSEDFSTVKKYIQAQLVSTAQAYLNGQC